MAKKTPALEKNQAKPSHGGARPNSGRPKGVPNKATAEIKAIAQPYSEEAVHVLAQIMTQGESEAARVSAANAILDRAWGKPSQAVAHTGEMVHTVTTKEQRDAAIAAFTRANG